VSLDPDTVPAFRRANGQPRDRTGDGTVTTTRNDDCSARRRDATNFPLVPRWRNCLRVLHHRAALTPAIHADCQR